MLWRRAVREAKRVLQGRGASARAREVARGVAGSVREGGAAAAADLVRILRTEGLTAPDQCLRLRELARDVREGVIVEVGSYRGRSSVALGLGSKRGRRVPVFAVEPHEEFVGEFGHAFGGPDRAAFYRNVTRAGVGTIVRLINLPSEEAARGWARPIGLLWIDGDHGYDAVRRDWDAWSPHLREDATVGFHDSNRPEFGPYRLVGELVDGGEWRVVDRVGSLTVLRRARAGTAAA